MNKLDRESIIGICITCSCSKYDQIYSNHEKDLIKDFIKSYLKDEDADKILIKAEKIESNSNQLLNYTSIIKKIQQKLKKTLLNIFGK